MLLQGSWASNIVDHTLTLAKSNLHILKKMKPSTFRNHKATQQSYDRLSGWYDLFTASERNIQRQAIRLLEPKSGESVLEIGFGTGHTLQYLAGCVGLSGFVAGVDLSSGMTKTTRRRLANNSQNRRAAPVIADAVDLPFRSGAFDGVIATFTLELFESNELPQVLGQCHRVLRPGGRLTAASLLKPADPNRAVAIYEWLHNAFPLIVDCHPIPVEQILMNAGFDISNTLNINIWGLPVQVVTARK
jgi:demethylmenaquinone methyltransferase/2-methoxy-6-polyprenyl-1,4-benzoquinol methylase